MKTRFLTRQYDVTPAELRRAIRDLTPAQRDAIVYCYFLGWTQERMAFWFKISRRAVRERIKTAMAALENKLRKYPAILS